MKNSQRKISVTDSENGSREGKPIQEMQQMRLQKESNPGLRGDYMNLFLLLGLYFLQGIPLGIIDAVPLILVNKGVTYEKQALYSFVGWPFSIKLLWAPIIDSFYSPRFGRRKSWFIPVQYSIGLTMIAFSFATDHILGNTESQTGISTENIMGFAASDAVTKLKLVEFGLKRETYGLLKMPLIPLQIIAPWIVTKLATKKPMRTFYYSYPFRLMIAVVNCLFLWATAVLVQENNSFPVYYYVIAIFVFTLEMLASYFTGITLWAFMARVSDPAIGGTYMTLLTTLSNLGGTWTSTAAIYFVKLLSFQWCPEKSYFCGITNSTLNTTTMTNVTNTVIENEPFIDGYYVENSIIWMCLIYECLKWLESVPKSLWRCKK
ncbi:acetyl-coenzyme A transporter 1-like protein [Leptotrombidium deliense]|uniref:Acetyl-coenzyme A transporter 1-like protein n=1 Tax=Leptotrombidium deliense TaxID=299467 RepID=A0A443S804_9ACAR|nr:acetyl-coenzyme A transporter 1-like protein [Leptotrombidium deliense]